MRAVFILSLAVATVSLHAAQTELFKTISHGAAVDLKSNLDPEKNTIVEFYADW